MYWEPAKYVAKLRTLKTDGNPLLLKVKMDPATMPGSTMGSTTVRKVNQEPAPRSAEASSRESGTRSREPYTGRIMKGSQR